MDNSNVSFSKNEKDLNKIYSILIIIGAVTTVCLVFFFTELFRNRNHSAEAQIFDAQQLGATDSSVLISWSGSESATEFTVICTAAGGGEIGRFTTQQPFAAIHGLEPYQDYRVSIVPIDKEGQHAPYELSCSTSPYCTVTEVTVEEVDTGSATVSWKYDGMDAGFTVVAYALDTDGRRHFTSEPVSIPAGAEKKCRLTGLFSELRYTVCVMPDTRYAQVCKSTFTTLKHSESYKDISVIRFVICEPTSKNTMMVTSTNQLNASSPYKTSMIISGSTDHTDNVSLTVYITDPDGQLISENVTPDILAGLPNEINYRPLMTELTSPEREGKYKVYAAFDQITVDRYSFSVVR